MGQAFDPTLFDDMLTPEARQALQARLADDPALAAAFDRWRRVRAALRERLEAHVPDRHLLVLYALAAGGQGGVLSDEERAALEAARPGLEAALAAHPALADVVRQIQADAALFDEVWEAPPASPRTRRDRRARPLRRGGVQRWVWRVSAVAAVVLFAVVLTQLVWRDQAMVTVHTAPGEVRVLTLADGSTVRLMGDSELTYADPARSGAFNRRARLTGRAFFDVVRNGQGFAVETPTALTTVLGTSFGVQAGEDATEVVLVTGRVALAPRQGSDRFVVLEPGQMSRVAAGALPATPAPVDLAEALEWTGLFIFRATPVPEALRRLSDHYGVPVTYTPSLAEEAVSGTFEQEQPLEDILRTLAATLGAEVREAGGGYELAR